MSTEDSESIGLVVGTRMSTPMECWVAVKDDTCVQLDDVVEIPVQHPENGGRVTFYGLVEHVEKKLEGLNFDSDTRLFKEGILPAELIYLAKVSITRIEPEIFMPPQPGEPVFRATGKGYDQALFFDQMANRLPAGLLQSGQPAWINFDFLDGSNGGHVSISGISGVATKTSYTLFLLHGILRGQHIPRDKQRNTRAIVFNVKNEDLLFLDQPNIKLSEKDRAEYTALGLPSEPFADVSFYAPCQSATGDIVHSAKTRMTGVQAYGWGLLQIASQRLLPYLFDDDRQGSNLSFVLDIVCNRLAEMAERHPHPILHTLDSHGVPLKSLAEFNHHLRVILDVAETKTDEAQRDFRHWFGNNATGTVMAFLRRFRNAVDHVDAFIRPDFREQDRIHWRQRKLTVVDINQLHSRAQMFVVGSLLKEIFDEKARTGDKTPVFIVLDELNRYAPRTGWSPIKEMLLDIAERGRSMGLILLGAQQTASEVEKRVVANAAIRVNGRLDAAESASKEYDYLRGAFRQRALMIRPGSMMVQQPEIPSPLLLSFPHPAWATRANEVRPSEAQANDFNEFTRH